MFWSDPWGAVINDNLSVVQAELLEKAKKTTEYSKKFHHYHQSERALDNVLVFFAILVF